MSHRAVKSHRATIASLKRNIKLWRARGASFKADRLERELQQAEAALGIAEENVRRGARLAFALGGANGRPGDEHCHVDGPSGVEIVLTVLDTPGQCRLTFRQLAVGRNVSIACRTEDASTLAELVVRGEQALFDADRTQPALGRVSG